MTDKELSDYRGVIDERREKYIQAFSTPDGKFVLHDLLKQAGFGVVNDATDPLRVMLMEGKRSIVLGILQVMNYQPEDYPALFEEAIQRARAERRKHTGV
jgi:hypothetical protein